MKKTYCTFVFLMCAACIVSAQNISITGTVQANGKPVANAALILKKAGLQAVTDSLGSYKIVGPTAITFSNKMSFPALPVLTGPYCSISLDRMQRVSIGLYSLSGAFLGTVFDKNLAIGSYHIPVSLGQKMIAGIAIVHVTIGGAEYHYTYYPLRSGSAVLGNPALADKNVGSRKVSVAFSDTLRCSKLGLKPMELVVTNPTGTYDFLNLQYNGPGMRRLTGATFTMGSSSPYTVNAAPVHQVTVTTFSIDTTLVTQSQYAAVMGVNPSTFTGDLNRPVDNETWYDAVLYCNGRSKQNGKDTVYSFTGISGTPGDSCWKLTNLVFTISKNGYRLPTEAEWEFACRAGTATTFYWGEDSSDATVGQYCWYYGNALNSTHPVATKKPNPYGLYDMGGNIWQWCHDWVAPYTSSSQTDPVGAASGTMRALRGAAYNNDLGLVYIRSAGRDPGNLPDTRTARRGFRCVCR